MTGDASILYDAGTLALERGQIGEAVALLAAARRIDPRAADARRNLAIAESQVIAARGESPPAIPSGPSFSLSTAEGWWLAALLLLAGAASGILALRGRRPERARLFRVAAIVAIATGLSLTAWLGAGADRERRHPEAVVVAASVEARRGVDEAPRTPILLRAGERLRTGRTRGEDVEVILGGSPVGWVPRVALWHVAEAPRYTGGLRSK
ncbi:MAG TPA: hypothetical protein VGQ14_04175 [Candidatus Eisenbacteria bacterium]|jgi:hypothetical protein|nr:hypothetical protein [Candidatus Eisenbacteria bacterium]